VEALTVQYREYKAVRPGTYRAKVKAVEQKPSNFKEGEHVLVVEFELQNGEAGRVLRKTYGMRLGPRAKLTSLFTRLIGPLRDGQTVDLRELIGKECEVVVTVESGQDGKQFAKIVDVFALEGA
jgi:hypothetical protein